MDPKAFLSDEDEKRERLHLRENASIFKRFSLSPSWRSISDLTDLRTFHSAVVRRWSYEGVTRVPVRSGKDKRYSFITIKRDSLESKSLPPTFSKIPSISMNAPLSSKPIRPMISSLKEMEKLISRKNNPNPQTNMMVYNLYDLKSAHNSVDELTEPPPENPRPYHRDAVANPETCNVLCSPNSQGCAGLSGARP